MIFRNSANYLPISTAQQSCENLKYHVHKHFYKPTKWAALERNGLCALVKTYYKFCRSIATKCNLQRRSENKSNTVT